MSESKLKVVVFGGTGAAGGGIVRACLEAPEVAEIIAPSRRGLGLGEHAALTEVEIADFGDRSALAATLGPLVEYGLDDLCYTPDSMIADHEFGTALLAEDIVCVEP